MVNAARAGTEEKRRKGTDNAGVEGFPARRRFPANDEVVFLFNQNMVGGAGGSAGNGFINQINTLLPRNYGQN